MYELRHDLVPIALALLFLYAASFKLVERTELEAAMSRLGVPRRISAGSSRLVVGYEIVLGLAVVGFAPPLFSAVLLGVVALGLILVGSVALYRHEAIPCACFSAGANSTIGWRQLGVSVGLLGCVFLHEALLEVVTPSRAAGRLVIVCVVGIVLHLRALVPDTRLLAGYRNTAAPLYPA